MKEGNYKNKHTKSYFLGLRRRLTLAYRGMPEKQITQLSRTSESRDLKYEDVFFIVLCCIFNSLYLSYLIIKNLKVVYTFQEVSTAQASIWFFFKRILVTVISPDILFFASNQTRHAIQKELSSTRNWLPLFELLACGLPQIPMHYRLSLIFLITFQKLTGRPHC